MSQRCSSVDTSRQCNSVAMSQRCSSAAVQPCLSNAAVLPCFSVVVVQQCSHVSTTFRQCSHISASQDRMVQGYKRRWSGGQPFSIPTPVDGSIEFLVLQYCPILSCISPLGCSHVSLPCLALVRSITSPRGKS
jgi:hypothetical protein